MCNNQLDNKTHMALPHTYNSDLVLERKGKKTVSIRFWRHALTCTIYLNYFWQGNNTPYIVFLFLNKACHSFRFTRLYKINIFAGQVWQQRTAKMQLLVVFILGIYESCCDGILEIDWVIQILFSYKKSQ